MDNGPNQEASQSVKMGATGNAARLAALQERKKKIEEILGERNNELRQLCIREAELTGIMPLEIPLEPGESPPTFRRRVGTSYQLSQNLINSLNNKEESIAALELQKQIQANMAEAALGLANEPNSTKTIRRQHKAQYQYHKQQYNLLEEKIGFLKAHTQAAQQQQKQKKKPRPTDQEDAISVATSVNDSFGKTSLRHSMRSLQVSLSDSNSEQQYSGHQRLAYRASDNTMMNSSPVYLRPDDLLAGGLYRLSLNGYNNYVERRESNSSLPSPQQQYVHAQSNPNIYQQHVYHRQKSPQNMQPYYKTNYPSLSNYNQYNPPKVQYFPSHTIHGQSSYKYPTDPFRTLNPHQLQPHQQYEHEVLSTGLGGYWKRTESGEMVWYNSGNTPWQRDRRFGSLDRPKNRRLHKRTSPLMDTKPTVPVASGPENERVSPLKPSTVTGRNRTDSRQLIRTQSLGSVGAQTVDSVWPSDDNSSCDNDTQSVNDTLSGNRKQKQKEWYETSLDGPAASSGQRSQSTIPTTEEKPPTPITPKPPLEIPAESNPSPRTEPNMELFKNHIPKNCTVLQAGVCKPYHEETKPFEMSDFYKYSTKFKKSPQKVGDPNRNVPSPQMNRMQRNLNFEDGPVQKTVYQPLQALKCQAFGNNNGSTSSLENYPQETEWLQENQGKNNNPGSPSKTTTLV